MTAQGQRICIVTDNVEMGDSLVCEVESATPFTCLLVRSLASLGKLEGGQSLALIFIDRSLNLKHLSKHKALLERFPVASFGKPATGSAALDYVESIARYRLRDPVEKPDLQRLFHNLTGPGQVEPAAEPCRPLHLYRGLVGESVGVKELKSVITQVAPSSANILILGETGTGKEVVARNIHYQSTNNGGPFIAVNCSAIPADLLESELFGHKRGAFTGAVSDRIGRFELASEGTLFLDEIGDMPLVLQVRLLRVLEERIIYPLGSDDSVPMTARLVAATHRDLEQLTECGTFREDLYYRLNVVPVTVPPLRDRKEDIPNLAHELSCRLRQEQYVSVEFTDEAIECMRQYEWPGNVRELANLVERLTVLHPDGRISAKDLPANIRGTAFGNDAPSVEQQQQPTVEMAEGFDLKEHMQLTEAALIRQALDSSGGVMTRAAELLQVRRTTLTEKVKRLGLDQMIKQAS